MRASLVIVHTATGKDEGAASLPCLVLLTLFLSGCAGAWVSGRPVYPDSWPVLETGHECPDLSGRYSVVSDEAPPLVYAAGDHPREIFLFITYGKPLPAPPLGRRLLAWHLAGIFDSRDQEEWRALTAYAGALEAEAHHPDRDDAVGWVEVRGPGDNTIEVRAGMHDRTMLSFMLRKEGQGVWTNKCHAFECKKGGVVVVGSFPPPPEENPTGQRSAVGAKITFFPATDGSLVALEEAYTGVAAGNMVLTNGGDGDESSEDERPIASAAPLPAHC